MGNNVAWEFIVSFWDFDTSRVCLVTDAVAHACVRDLNKLTLK